MIICFNGVDGSGKSLQAQRLVAQLNAAGYPAVHVWTGGKRSLRRPLIRAGKRLLRGGRSSSDNLRPTGGSNASAGDYRAYLASTQGILKRRGLYTLWQHISLLEHAVEIWAMVLPHLMRKNIVVCDRYLHDSIVRVAVLAGIDAAQLPHQLRLLGRYPVPRPTIGFLIDVPSEVAFSRKDDIPDIEFLERRVPLYRAAADALNFHTVDGNRSPDQVAAQVWQKVSPLLLMQGHGVRAEVEEAIN